MGIKQKKDVFRCDFKKSKKITDLIFEKIEKKEVF